MTYVLSISSVNLGTYSTWTYCCGVSHLPYVDSRLKVHIDCRSNRRKRKESKHESPSPKKAINLGKLTGPLPNPTSPNGRTANGTLLRQLLVPLPPPCNAGQFVRSCSFAPDYCSFFRPRLRLSPSPSPYKVGYFQGYLAAGVQLLSC